MTEPPTVGLNTYSNGGDDTSSEHDKDRYGKSGTAVLICAMGAIVMGAMIFLPYL